MKIKGVHTIFYVENKQQSTEFYERILGRKADLNVPGMTEFRISDDFVLGLMPNSGIAKILGDETPNPSSGKGIPRCELYLYVADVDKVYMEIRSFNIKIISPLEKRNWGDYSFYFSDLDGHIIAFAEKIEYNE
ncbi:MULTISPECIES: VOC family protein [Chryseobacterium]|uniref:VOC family protein n=1 Tax=Chryseobacterium sp. R2A-55 TaxID=2744445 RepID=UPI001F28C657|nr:VOC family protein [Chryseobacterium sp. R2A-55]